MNETDHKINEAESQEQPLCFFENRNCRYYPCHTGLERINCLFCFCPLYTFDDCGGTYILINGIKDCSECLLPHKSENYCLVLRKLVAVNRLKSNHEIAEPETDQSHTSEQLSYLERALHNIE